MSSDRPVDGGRQRCTGCGHPRNEHRGPNECSVPKCSCDSYAVPEPVEAKGKGKP